MRPILQNLVFRLKSISRLSKDNTYTMKLNTSDGSLECDTYITAIRRNMRGDSHEKTFLYIRDLYAECVDYLSLDKDKSNCQMLMVEMKNSLEGIKTLENTYKEHSNFVDRLDIQRKLVLKNTESLSE